MNWADYRKNSKKAEAHVGSDLNRSITRKIFLTEGNSGERAFVSQILTDGETDVLDRVYQCRQLFDAWQKDGKAFICRIKAGTKRTVVKSGQAIEDSIVFYDAVVHLGSSRKNITKKEVRLVGYAVEGAEYRIATNRHDLSGEQIAAAYKLRWDIDFFVWWKKHLKVCRLIARNEQGLMVQMLAGLITYLLLAIYCHEKFNEKVPIKRVRELRIKIQNELHSASYPVIYFFDVKEHGIAYAKAKT